MHTKIFQLQITDIKRTDGISVDVTFEVYKDGAVVPATDAENTYKTLSDLQLSAAIGYPVSMSLCFPCCHELKQVVLAAWRHVKCLIRSKNYLRFRRTCSNPALFFILFHFILFYFLVGFICVKGSCS